MEAQVQYRIGWISASLMLSIAIIADLLQILFTITVILAIAGDIVTVVAEGFIISYFLLRGVHFLKGKLSLGRILFFLVTLIIELVPILDALPLLTADTIYNIYSSRKEDRLAFTEKQAQLAARRSEEAKQQQRALNEWARYEAYIEGLAERQQVDAEEESAEELEDA